jgi:nucleoside-diphosphate-sugar epimerase
MLEKSALLDNVSLGWGRIFFLYGPGEKPGRLVSGIISNLLAGRRIETTAGTQIRDFTHVADVAGAFAALCDSDVTGPINIASGHTLCPCTGSFPCWVSLPDARIC